MSYKVGHLAHEVMFVTRRGGELRRFRALQNTGMTDPAERHSLLPRGTFGTSNAGDEDARARSPETAPLESYVAELRRRIEHEPDTYEELTVPPGAEPRAWVAPSIESALQAMTETVPRSPSSPDSPLAFPNDYPSPPSVPPAALASRNVRRRPNDDTVPDFPVELEGSESEARSAVVNDASDAGADGAFPNLSEQERGHRSGRFAAPQGLRVATDGAESISSAVAHMIDAAHARRPGGTTQGRQSGAQHAATTDDVPAADPEPDAARNVVASPDIDARVTATSAHASLTVTVVARSLQLFVAAFLAGATIVYFLLRG